MSLPLKRPNPDDWIDRIFAAKAAQTGGVVRRDVSWVAREIGEDRLIDEVRRRGFHMIRAGGQFIVICNAGGIQIVV